MGCCLERKDGKERILPRDGLGGSYVPYPGKMESGSRGWTSDCHNRLGGWISNRRNGPEQELYDRTDMEYS